MQSIVTYPYIYELDYDAMHRTDRFCAMDQFFIFKIKIVDPTIQNDFRMNI
jgi:hypothetical protein